MCPILGLFHHRIIITFRAHCDKLKDGVCRAKYYLVTNEISAKFLPQRLGFNVDLYMTSIFLFCKY